ncbi:hypothetical protein GC194_07605 [bacterium]|nr:hypothetical protein [bacterium]
MNNTYCVVDIEATGGNHKNGRIIEIGIVKIRGGMVISEYSTLVNPQQPIDKYVSKLTGIKDSDLVEAPIFAEVTHSILEFLGDAIFVAHNATFDYAYLRAELKKQGVNYFSDQLCTIDLSRKIFPNQESYSLGKLCRSLGLDVSDRHRALGDAMSTAVLFLKLMESEKIRWAIDSTIRKGQPLSEHAVGQMKIDDRMFADLPDEPGVFYLNNEAERTLYVGRGESIKTCAQRLFSDGKRFERFKIYEKQFHHIEYELTGNELLAELMFYERVFSLQPVLNAHLKQLEYRYCLSVFNKGKSLKLGVVREKDKLGIPLAFFKDYKTAEKRMKLLIDKYTLDAKQAELRLTKVAKNRNQLSRTELRKMAAQGVFKQVLAEQKSFQPMGYFAGTGRKAFEKVVFKIVRGAFEGFAYIDDETQGYNKEWIDENLEKIEVKDAAKICWQFFLQTNQYTKVF